MVKPFKTTARIERPDGVPIIWAPHDGVQTYALSRSEPEIGFGGGRGGGKTDDGIVFIAEPYEHEYYAGLVIRKNADDLKDWVARASKIFLRLGFVKAGSPPVYTHPSGARIVTGHLKDENAFEKYQGHEYQRILVEEIGQIARLLDYLKLLGSCRTTHPELPARAFVTWNWGGPGHKWLKKRFYDPAPPGTPFKDPETGKWRIFIPALIEDNPTLMENDPGYLAYLNGLPEPLRSAWRYGDPDSFAGQYFAPFYPKVHVIDAFGPFADPELWTRGGYSNVVGLDWGYHHNFAAMFCAVDFDDNHYFYREIVGNGKKADYWADEVLEQTDEREPIEAYPMGKDAWNVNPATKTISPNAGEPIIEKDVASVFISKGIYVHKANDARVTGFHRMLELLGWEGEVTPDGVDFDGEGAKRPKFYIIKGTCPQFEECLTSALSSDAKPEDVAKFEGDDPLDSARNAINYSAAGMFPAAPVPVLQQRIERLRREPDEGGETYGW